MKNTPDRWQSVKLAALGACGLFALYFARLGSYPLIDPDEPVYGQVAKEMAAGAGWLTPHYCGKMWFDKPPLYYWLSGLCARVLGPTELASRLPSAVLAVALVLVVYALASYDFGKRAGVVAAVAMATCLQQIVIARAAITDMTLALSLTAALYAYRRWLDASGRGKLGWMALCGAATGLGMLDKGPVAPLLLLTAFVIHLIWIKQLNRLISADAGLGIAAALLVGLPWFVAMYILHRQAFVQGFLVLNNITRFTRAEHVSQSGMWYSHLLNVPYALLFFFPWSPFLPWAFLRTWKLNTGAKLASVWIAVVFVFFSASSTILVTYIFPLYPAAAVLVGSLFSLAASKDSEAIKGLQRGHWLLLSLSCLLALGLAIIAEKKFPQAEADAIILGAIIVAFAAVACAQVCFYRQAGRAHWVTGLGMAVFSLWLVVGLMPRVEARLSTRDLVRQVPFDNARAVFAEFHLFKPSLQFYVGDRLLDLSNVEAANLLSGKKPAFVFCKESEAHFISVPGCLVWAKSAGLEALANTPALSLKGSKS